MNLPDSSPNLLRQYNIQLPADPACDESGETDAQGGRLRLAPAVSISLFIPSQMLYRVFSFLSSQDLAGLCPVCRQWAMISESDPLWRVLHERELPQLSESLEKEVTHLAAAEGLSAEEAEEVFSVDVFEPVFPRRWKDAVRERTLYSCVTRPDAEEYVPIVIDNGAHMMQAGFGGAELPELTVPSCIAFPTPSQEITPFELPFLRREADFKFRFEKFPAFLIGSEIKSDNRMMDRYTVKAPVFDDRGDSFEDLTSMWAYLFDTLHTDPSLHPVLLTQPLWSPTALKPALMEIMFEVFSAPATYVHLAPLLTAYAYGDLTGLVVDLGATGCQVVPVWQGVILEHSARRLPHLGGHALDNYILNAFDQELESSPDVSQLEGHNFTFFAAQTAARVKESLCVVQDFGSAQGTRQPPVITLPPPYGQVQVSSQLGQLCGDYIFQGGEAFGDPEASLKGLAQVVAEVVQSCAVDIRPQLYGNVMVSGGLSMVSGFDARLQRDLELAMPWASERVSVRTDELRQHATWQGGSILSGLPAFQDMWYLKSEYEEVGIDALLAETEHSQDTEAEP
mmetsp:Transcript_33985/g.66926  ORF Transcript_33985/g.66926 Transcript_33985/m.66926 type:complete len:567 (+) Transcript_33985:1320-3020(+)